MFNKAIHKKGRYISKKVWLIISIILYALSILIGNFFAYNATPERVAKTLHRSILKKEQLFYNLLTDSEQLRDITVRTDSISNRSSLLLDRMPIGVFVYRVNDVGHPLLVRWSSSFLDVSAKTLGRPDGAYAVSNTKGFFEQINKTVYLNADTFKVIGVIPVYWQYLQASPLFKDHFDGYPNLAKDYGISTSGVPVYNGQQKVLFHISRIDSGKAFKGDNLSLCLKLISLSIWLLLFNSFARRFTFKHGFFAGVSLFIGILLVSRLLSYYFPFPFEFRSYDLFDPLIYASSWLHRSLGDLLVNLLLLLWISSFVKKNMWMIQRSPKAAFLWKWRKVVAILGICVLSVLSIIFVREIETLVSDSQISFNVTNFFSMNIYTVVCVVALAFFMWSYVRISYLLLYPAHIIGYSILKKIIIVLATGVMLAIFFSNADHILSDCLTILWLAIYLLVFDFYWKALASYFVASRAFLVMVVLFSASFTCVIYTEYRQLELKDRRFFAENLAMRSDETGESLIRIGINNINSYFLQNGIGDLLSESKSQALKYRIVNENFSGYLNRYNTNVYTFDSAHRPLYNSDSTRFETLQNNIQMLAKNTEVPDLYYNNTNPDQFSFIYRKKLHDPRDSSKQLYLFILLKPLRYSDNQLDVRLFNSAKALPGDLDNDYSYAIYYNRKLVSRHLNDNYSSGLNELLVPKEEYKLINTPNKSILVYNAGDNKVIVVTKKINVWLDILTLFAYIFCSAMVVLSLSYFFSHFFFSGFNIRYLKGVMRLTINRRLQATIVFLSLFSFLIVSIFTITFSLAQFRETSKVKLSKSAKIIEDETINSIRNDLFMDSSGRQAEENYPKDLFARKVLQIAELNDVDINYYNLDGTLEASTQPTIYGHGFFNSLMNPRAFFMLKNYEQMEYTQNENIGSFKFSSIYFPLQDLQGNDIAYINIPYLNSQNEARLQISQFLVTVIDLNALIFIFAGFMAIRFTRKITTTFDILASKMRVINLTGKNESLVYKRRDEIGALVSGYNMMVQKLSQSAEALAKSERQGAWREMARQIAHEIKNPLTPMKLSIQYLDRAIESGAPNASELSKRVTQTLIEQIDQLAQIAGDFSQFANINNASPVKMDLRDNLKSLVQLYFADNDLNMHLSLPAQSVMIDCDKSQINRMFTNLIKNAIEASDSNARKNIYIDLNVQNGWAITTVKDEGAGIPEDMKQKIFVPNFTTKSSGTGLGLAICRGICERAGGTIHFESELGVGTTFIVSLPLIESDATENED